MRRFLVIDAEGAALKDRASVRIVEFRSQPEESGEPGARLSTPTRTDTEKAISALTECSEYGTWRAGDEPRTFIVVPLDDAYTVNVRPKSQVEISSSGSLP